MGEKHVIIERKRMMEELGKLSQFRESIIDNANVWLDVLDENANVVIWNKAAEVISGYSREEVIGHGKIWEWLYPDEEYRKSITDLVTDVIQHGRVDEDFETRIRRKDGQTRIISWNERNLLDEHDKVVGSIAIGRDVTERKLAEEALRESEEKYRTLFEQAMDGIGLADAETGILLECNHALAALVGRDRAELLGQHQAILHPPASDDSTFSPTFRLHTTTREGQVLETQVITRTGEIREVEIKANLLYLQGRKTLQGIFHDITERKRAEEALRRRAEELAALQATVLDITGSQDLPVLLQTIVERAARLIGAPAGGIYLCDHEKQEVRCVVSYKTPQDYTGTTLKYGEGAAGIVAQTGKPLIIDDYRSWQGRAAVYEEEQPFAAVLTVPMIWQDRVTGVIHVLGDTARRRFTQADQTLLTLFANHAAIAVENTRLLELEKHHSEELARYSTSLEQLVFERTAKLAESERRFRELADLLPQIVFEIDENGNLQFMNRAAFALTGRSEEDLRKGLNAFDLFAQEEHERAVQGIRRITAGETIGGREFTVVRRDGTTCPVLVYTAPVMREGKAAGLRGIAIDITDRKRAEEQLRAARERLDYVISSNPAVIFTGKPHSDLTDFDNTYMSGSVTALLGHDPRDFIDDPQFWSKHIHPEDRDRVRAAMPRLFKDGHLGIDYRFMHKNSRYRWIHEEVRAVPDADGNPLEVIGYWTDITERRKMEEELREARERLEYLITSNPAVIYSGKPLADLSDWHLTYVSQRVNTMLGFEPWRFIGDPEFWKHHVHPEDLASTMAQVPRLWKEGQHTFEYRFLHKDGTYRWIREEATVVHDADGKPIEVNGYWIDVTERERLEEALAKSQRLATIGELAAMVGHDLRNPLQGIAGAAYYLRTEEKSKLSKKGKEVVQLIQESIEHSDKIINDLLEYSTELHLELSKTSVKSITKDALAEVKIPKGVRVVNTTKNQPPMKLDVHKMRRVFMNLIQNALDAMPNGGTLTITSTRSRDNLYITFKDTGIGMTTDTLAKLWSPLFTTKAKGMGLGLATIKRFVEAHEGSIGVETKLGNGSTFTVTLPIKRSLKGE